VAAKAILQRGKMPHRLITVLEGESLVNDATGLMLYRMAVAAVLTGAFSWVEAATTFSILAVGGVAFGLVAGWGVNVLFARLRDPQVSIVISFLFSWAAYIAAEALHVSGVLAVVAAGLVMGARQHAILDAASRVQAQAVWRTLTFVMEALVFVIIGLSLRDIVAGLGGLERALIEAGPFALAITAACIAARFVWVFPATYGPRWILPAVRARDPYPRLAVPLIVSWAGMRGVVSLAAALALPLAFPERDLILFTTFVVIAITVLVQGVSLGPLVGWLKPEAGPLDGHAHLGEAQARMRINAAGLAHLEQHVDPSGALQHPRLADQYRRRVRASDRHASEGAAMAEERNAHFDMSLAAIAAARAELLKLHDSGQIHDDTLHALEAELDFEELRWLRIAGRAER
jgi:CPA1 family monovalent cation:H+ antiporter